MYKELTEDLISKLKTVPGFNGRVAVVPAAAPKSMPKPAAFVIYEGDSIVDTDVSGQGFQENVMRWSVAIIIDFKNQNDIMDVQLPFLEACVMAVSGKESLSFSLPWKYEGKEFLGAENEMAIYQLNFSCSSAYVL